MFDAATLAGHAVEFVLDLELFAFEFRDVHEVGLRPAIFVVDLTFEACVFYFERLELVIRIYRITHPFDLHEVDVPESSPTRRISSPPQ